MSRDIAVICATPPGANPGMDSVDLAFVQLAERHGFHERILLHRLYQSGIGAIAGGKGSYPYAIFPGPELFPPQRAIVYWGDFLHMRQYELVLAHQYLVAHGISQSVAAAQQRVHEALLLAGQDSAVFRRTISFGTTLFVNSIRDELDDTYGPLLERFVRDCRDVWFRDVMSALKACHLRGSYEQPCLGVDCAMLVDPAQFDRTDSVEDRGHLGIFLGRTTYRPYVEQMYDFALVLAKELDLAPRWIAWGDTVAFPPLAIAHSLDRVRSLDGFTVAAATDPRLALNNLRRHRVIVTDTYHVCVNAWNLGIPAICLAENEFSETRNTGVLNYFSRRDKKHLFMSMYDALDFFVPTNELVNADYRRARLAHLTGLLDSQRETDAIHQRIRTHARAAEAAFVEALRRILQGSE